MPSPARKAAPAGRQHASSRTQDGLTSVLTPEPLPRAGLLTGWPVAAVLAFFAVPYVRRATEAIVRMIEGQA